MMEPLIKTISEKKLVGKRLSMSLADNKTVSLWQSFMPRRKEIINAVNSDLISMQVYDKPLVAEDIHQVFDKWAVIEVEDLNSIPSGMEVFILPAGQYAVFHYKGLSSDINIFHYILGTWLPNSNYELDHRPHFEVLGEKYKNNDPNSEEEIWVPIKLK